MLSVDCVWVVFVPCVWLLDFEIVVRVCVFMTVIAFVYMFQLPIQLVLHIPQGTLTQHKPWVMFLIVRVLLPLRVWVLPICAPPCPYVLATLRLGVSKGSLWWYSGPLCLRLVSLAQH